MKKHKANGNRNPNASPLPPEVAEPEPAPHVADHAPQAKPVPQPQAQAQPPAGQQLPPIPDANLVIQVRNGQIVGLTAETMGNRPIMHAQLQEIFGRLSNYMPQLQLKKALATGAAFYSDLDLDPAPVPAPTNAPAPKQP